MNKASIIRMKKLWAHSILGGALVVLASSMVVRGESATLAGTGGWEMADAVYSGRSADISDHTADARAVVFKPDGLAMYVIGRATRNIVEYSLDQPWDVSSAEYARELSIEATAAHGLFFNPATGIDMFVLNRTEILQYKLDIPWDIATAALLRRKSLSCDNVSLIRGHDIHFAPAGDRFYVEDRIHQEVYQYALATPWDVATLMWEDTLDISDQQIAVRGIELHPHGGRMWLMDTARREILEYELAVPWQIASASFQKTFDVSGQALNPRGLTWRPDGSAFYVTDTSRQRILQYTVVIPWLWSGNHDR